MAAEDLLRGHARRTWSEQNARRSGILGRLDRNEFGGFLEMAAILIDSKEALDIVDRIEREFGETPPGGPALFEVN